MKIEWNPEKPIDPFDRSEMGQISIDCLHCHQPTYVLHRSVADAEAKHWKLRYERLTGQLNAAIKICHKKHGTDPMSRDMMEMLIKLRDDLERGF